MWEKLLKLTLASWVVSEVLHFTASGSTAWFCSVIATSVLAFLLMICAAMELER